MTELTPGARALLDAARRAPPGPSEEAIERMERGVLATVGLAAAAGTAGAAAAKGAGLWSAVLGKVVLGSALLVVGGVVGAAIVSRRPVVPLSPRRSAPVLVERLEQPLVLAPPPVSAPEPEPAVLPPPPPVKKPRAKPELPLAAERGEGWGEGPDSSRELALLRSAMEHLEASEWSEGLVELDHHDAEFPGGQLQNEADVLRVLGLCGLERVSSALELAATLRARAPNSPALSRLTASCVNP